MNEPIVEEVDETEWPYSLAAVYPSEFEKGRLAPNDKPPYSSVRRQTCVRSNRTEFSGGGHCFHPFEFITLCDKPAMSPRHSPSSFSS